MYGEPGTGTGKIKREFMAHFINAAMFPEGNQYEWLGDDLEEFNVEMNANVETKNNIKGKTTVNLDSYQPKSSVEPYYAEKGTKLFKRLQTIIDDRQTLDELKTDVIEAHLWEPYDEESFRAIKEEVIIEVVSYGGNTTGYQIPFNIHYTGKRVKGVYNPDGMSFTEVQE